MIDRITGRPGRKEPVSFRTTPWFAINYKVIMYSLQNITFMYSIVKVQWKAEVMIFYNIQSKNKLITLSLFFECLTVDNEKNALMLYVCIWEINALLFYKSKMILDSPNCFVVPKSLWSGPNHFGWVQIILVWFKSDFSGLIFKIWTCPKWFGSDQNKLNLPKTIGTRPKWFGRSKIILGP